MHVFDSCPSCGDSRHRIVGGGDEWVDECGNELCVHYPFRPVVREPFFDLTTADEWKVDKCRADRDADYAEQWS